LDLVPAKEDQDRLIERIRKINSTAEVVPCVNCEVDLAEVLNLRAFDLQKILQDDPAFLPEKPAKRAKLSDDEHEHHHKEGEHCEECESGHEHHHHHKEGEHCEECESGHEHHHHHKEGEHCEECESGHDHKHDHDHDHGHHHHHDDRVSSVAFRVLGNLNEDKFQAWIGPLLQEHGPSIYRMKGVLAFAGSADKYVFQGVHMIFTGEPVEPWGEGEVRENRLVFIGKDLAELDLDSGFRACLEATSE
jgi:G3E family GTPase